MARPRAKSLSNKQTPLSEALADHVSSYRALRTSHLLNQAVSTSCIVTLSYIVISVGTVILQMQEINSNSDAIVNHSAEDLDRRMGENSLIGTALLVFCYLAINQINFWRHFPATSPHNTVKAESETKKYREARAILQSRMYYKAAISIAMNAFFMFRLPERLEATRQIKNGLALDLIESNPEINGVYKFEGTREDWRSFRKYLNFAQGIFNTSPSKFNFNQMTFSFKESKTRHSEGFKIPNAVLNDVLQFTVFEMLQIRLILGFVAVSATSLMGALVLKYRDKMHRKALHKKHDLIDLLLMPYNFEKISHSRARNHAFYRIPNGHLILRGVSTTITSSAFVDLLSDYLPVINTPHTIAFDLNEISESELISTRSQLDAKLEEMLRTIHGKQKSSTAQTLEIFDHPSLAPLPVVTTETKPKRISSKWY